MRLRTSAVRAACLSGCVTVLLSVPARGQAPSAGDESAPVTIMAVGNRLFVTSDDPQALALVNELVRMLTKPGAGDGDFAVIRLRNARAADAARLLDECYNGTRDAGAGQGGRGLNPFMGGF